MENKEKKEAGYNLLYLSACVLNGITPDSEKVATMNTENLVRMSKFHDMPALCCYALESAGVKNEELVKLKNNAIRRVMLMDAERKQLLSHFEESGIWYMALKGVYLKEYYPKIGMREMSDNDILVDETRMEDINSFMVDRGYEEPVYKEQNDWGYKKKPVYSFEMHRSLFGDYHRKDMYDYYTVIKEKLKKTEGTEYGYHFTDEDFYIYMITHEYKHYIIGGTGLRSLTDTYVFIKKHESLDWNYIEQECEKIGTKEFEKINRELSLKALSSPVLPKLSAEEDEMLFYLLTSGTYGTVKHKAQNRIDEIASETGSSSKFKYIMRRLFPPMDIYRVYFPFFYRHKYLLPVGWVYRLVRGIFLKKSMIKTEMEYISKENKK